MHSPAHRENILDCKLHQMGVGLAIAARPTPPYWVQDFATPDGVIVSTPQAGSADARSQFRATVVAR